MQVLLHTDKNIDGGVRTAEYLETLAQGELHRFGEHITRVEAHLADANSHAKANKDDIHCTLEAHVKGLQPVVVKDHAGSTRPSTVPWKSSSAPSAPPWTSTPPVVTQPWPTPSPRTPTTRPAHE